MDNDGQLMASDIPRIAAAAGVHPDHLVIYTVEPLRFGDDVLASFKRSRLRPWVNNDVPSRVDGRPGLSQPSRLRDHNGRCTIYAQPR